MCVTNFRCNVVNEEESYQMNKGNQTPVNKCSCHTKKRSLWANVWKKVIQSNNRSKLSWSDSTIWTQVSLIESWSKKKEGVPARSSEGNKKPTKKLAMRIRSFCSQRSPYPIEFSRSDLNQFLAGEAWIWIWLEETGNLIQLLAIIFFLDLAPEKSLNQYKTDRRGLGSIDSFD